MPTILVYGATGPQQRPVAERLLAAGFQVRLLVRDVDAPAVKALVERGATALAGDLSRPETLRAASRGVDGASLFVPFMSARADFGRHAIDAARLEGVTRVVWNPTGTIPDVRTGNPAMDARAEVLEHLRASGLDWVAIEPTAYLENLLMPALVDELRAHHRLAYPMPRESRMQWIAHDDVAQFVVRAFQSPSVSKVRIAVCGPELLGGDAIAEQMSRALGRTITFRPMPPVEFGDVLDRAMGPGTGARVVGFYEQIFARPELFGSRVDLGAALAQLPIEPTRVEDWARARRAILT